MERTVTLVTATDERDINRENQYRQLNAQGFVRGDTALDQWHLLVAEAWRTSMIPENELVHDYLVVMLHRFMSRANLFELLSVFDYCLHVLGTRKLDAPCVQEVADMSLQYVAFFPERSAHRHEPRSLEYSSEIGVSLYQQLAKESKGKDDWFSHAYEAMAESFGQAAMVLRSACPRFVHKTIIAREQYAQAHHIPTDFEARSIADTATNFGLMFCEGESGPSTKNN